MRRSKILSKLTEETGKHAESNIVCFKEDYARLVVESLLNEIALINGKTYSILDACCGDGVLGKSFKHKIANTEIDYVDIDKNNCFYTTFTDDFYILDILKVKTNWRYDIIICNPPWIPVELPEQIFHHLRTLLAPNGVLFFVINNTFVYQGWKRAITLPIDKYIFLPRYTFASSGNALLDCGVIVSKKETTENKCFIHLPKEYNSKQEVIKNEQ